MRLCACWPALPSEGATCPFPHAQGDAGAVRRGADVIVLAKVFVAVAHRRRAEESTTPEPPRTVAAQACAAQEGCGQLIRVKPWVRSPLSAEWYCVCRTHYSVDNRALARFAPPASTGRERLAALGGEEVTWARAALSQWCGHSRADVVLRRPGGVTRERGRAVLPDQRREVNSPSVVPGFATRSPVFSWKVRSNFVASRRLPASWQNQRRLTELVRTLRARFRLDQAYRDDSWQCVLSTLSHLNIMCKRAGKRTGKRGVGIAELAGMLSPTGADVVLYSCGRCASPAGGARVPCTPTGDSHEHSTEEQQKSRRKERVARPVTPPEVRLVATAKSERSLDQGGRVVRGSPQALHAQGPTGWPALGGQATPALRAAQRQAQAQGRRACPQGAQGACEAGRAGPLARGSLPAGRSASHRISGRPAGLSRLCAPPAHVFSPSPQEPTQTYTQSITEHLCLSNCAAATWPTSAARLA